ncbi:DUF6541 family protein [Pseudonocardia saturnea]
MPIEELSAWAAAGPALAVAAALFVLPGLLVAYAAGLRGITAWGSAPLVSVGSVAVAAVLAGLFGIGWSTGVAVVPALLLAAVAAAVTRLRRTPEPDGRWVTLAAAGGLVVGGVLAMAAVVAGTDAPSALSQTYDAVFHYSSVARILAEGDASSLTAGTLNAPGAASAFYPAAWHDVVSLVVLGSGASIPVATSAVVAVVAALVWPLGCTLLVRQVCGPTWTAVAVAPVVAAGFTAFPWMLMTFGVLWPNLLGMALVPAGLAAVVAVCGLGPVSLTRWHAAALLLVAAVALGLAHPNTLFSLAALAVPPLGWSFVRRVRAWVQDGRRLLAVGVAAAVAVGSAGVAVFALTSPLLAGVRDFNWPAYEMPSQAVGEVLTTSTNLRDAAWTMSALVLVGLVAAWRTPDRRWLVPAHAVSAALFVLAASLDTPLSAALTGFWYNDSHRLAAMLPITGVPLAALGITAISTALPRIRPGFAVLLTTAAVVVASSGMYAREHAELVDDAYPAPTQPHGLLSLEEQSFYARIAPLIEPDAVVAQNPWSGSALLWALTGREVLFPHLGGEWTADQRYLAAHLREVTTDPQVCVVAERLRVRYLLVGVNDFLPQDVRTHSYPGLATPSAGFTRVAADSSGNALYALTGCGTADRGPSGTD